MNDNVRRLIRYICDGAVKEAQQQARIILDSEHTEKNKRFREEMIRKLETKKKFIELPYNLKSLLIAEDCKNFAEEKFLLRENEMIITQKILALFRASNKLIELGIPYMPTLMLYGKSGCGKTEFARYIAYKADLPFVYVKFSNLIDSALGSTQKNVSRIFEYVKSVPCVLCFDEIDTIGMERGQKDDVGEMNRVVIALMQEIDQLSNNAIIIGTTNRFDRLDRALIRRFSLQYEVAPLSASEGIALANKFFDYTEIKPIDMNKWYISNNFSNEIPAYMIIKACTEYVVNQVLKESAEQALRERETK